MIPDQYLEHGVPLPTLYGGSDTGANGVDGAGNSSRRPRMGAVDFLLYNIGAMLAGVAAGYDVRLSNVSTRFMARFLHI